VCIPDVIGALAVWWLTLLVPASNCLVPTSSWVFETQERKKETDAIKAQSSKAQKLKAPVRKGF